MDRKEYMKLWRQTPKAKESNRKKSARYRKSHPDKVREIEKRRYPKRKNQILQHNEHRRARLFCAEGGHTTEEWLRICALCEGRCLYCNNSCDKFAKDHVIPLSKGGSNYIENIVPVCKSCNSSKGSKSPEEFALWLLRKRGDTLTNRPI